VHLIFHYSNSETVDSFAPPLSVFIPYFCSPSQTMEVTGVKAHTINNLISVVEHNQSFVYEYAGYPLMPAPSLCGAESAREFINKKGMYSQPRSEQRVEAEIHIKFFISIIKIINFVTVSCLVTPRYVTFGAPTLNSCRVQLST
jgi:hypothetical protein